MTGPLNLALAAVEWDPKIYPRARWSTATVERYAEAIGAGDQFPPLVLERGTNRLLDGKHRLEAYKRAEVAEVAVEWHVVPEGMSPKRYAATLSARHGDRMSNADLKALAIEEAEADPKGFDLKAFVKDMGIGQATVYDWVGHILSREREERQAKALRLSMLGWTQQEIAELLDVARTTITADVRNSESVKADIRRLASERVERHEIARRFNLAPALVEAVTLGGLDDETRMKKLGIKIQPYDVWQFAGCHDLMGDSHPGRIPGELATHVLYFYTKPGDLVVDPMAGSGTMLDACLLMGRKARGYDIDLRHERIDVEQHDLSAGWPDSVARAKLVFWDPPYFAKMDSAYADGSVSRLDPGGYLQFFAKQFTRLHGAARPGTTLAFLMSDYDDDDGGIFLWDYADLLRDAGWALARQIQCPLPTQQVHPDIVGKFRQSRRLARLGRYLLIAGK